SSILHVDDDILQLKLTQVLLKKLKDEVKYLPYSSPLLALEDLVNKKISPNIIFLDLNMDECSGWQFLEEMEKKELSFPVVIVSSTIDIEDYEKSKTYTNVKGFICKPLSVEKIRDLLFV
ncbi:MAG: response regulator, partial [Candidatus Pacearchaeota archaeon]